MGTSLGRRAGDAQFLCVCILDMQFQKSEPKTMGTHVVGVTTVYLPSADNICNSRNMENRRSQLNVANAGPLCTL